MWIGGWYNNYEFVGDIDEVRISKVVRSADWVRLQYENQKPLQTLADRWCKPAVRSPFRPHKLLCRRVKPRRFQPRPAAQRRSIGFSRGRAEKPSSPSTGSRSVSIRPGRRGQGRHAPIQGDLSEEIRTREIPITILEDIPEPAFTLKAPAKWDGRSTIEVAPQIGNLAAMQAKDADDLKIKWNVSPIAVTKELHRENSSSNARRIAEDNRNSHFQQRRKTNDSDGDHRRYGTKARCLGCRNTGEGRKTSGQPVLRAR